MILLLLFYPICTITSEGYVIKIPWSKYHGIPNTSNYGPKPLISYKNSIFLQKEGALAHPKSLTPRGIFQVLHCAVHFAFRCSTKHSTAHSAPQNVESLLKSRPSWVAPNRPWVDASLLQADLIPPMLI